MEKLSLETGQAVQIYWCDSASLSGWKYNPETASTIGKIISLGYVVKAKEYGLTITSSMATDKAALDPVTIPWGAIEKLVQLPKLHLVKITPKRKKK